MMFGKTWKLIKRILFSKDMILIYVGSFLLFFAFDFAFLMYKKNPNLGYEYIINLFLYTKEIFFGLMPMISAIILGFLYVFEKRFLQKEYKKYFKFATVANIGLIIFLMYNFKNYIVSARSDFLVEPKEVECKSSTKQNSMVIECTDGYKYIFDTKLEVKKESPKICFERG